MKAIVVGDHLGPRRHAVVDIAAPRPRAGESVVALLAAPIEPMDRLMLRGLYPLSTQASIDGAMVLGAQGVGQVEHSDRPELVGARVLLPIRSGTWRTRLALPTGSLVALPDHIGTEAAAPLRIGAVSADAMLESLRPGDAFVQSPGAGAVSLYAVQLARRRGLQAICLVRNVAHRDLLLGLGAHAVIEDDDEAPAAIEALGLEPHLALDGTGGATTRRLAASLVHGGSVVRYGAISGSHAQLDVAASVFRDIRVRGFWLKTDEQRRGPQAVRQRLARLLGAELALPIAARYPLGSIEPALAHAGSAVGRVLLVP